MKYQSPYEKFLSVEMNHTMCCFCGWNLDVGVTKPEYLKELDSFMDDYEFKLQKNSDIAKSVIKMLKEGKIVVKRPLTEKETETLYQRAESMFDGDNEPSEYEIAKEGDFQRSCEFDWKTALLPIAEGKFDKVEKLKPKSDLNSEVRSELEEKLTPIIENKEFLKGVILMAFATDAERIEREESFAVHITIKLIRKILKIDIEESEILSNDLCNKLLSQILVINTELVEDGFLVQESVQFDSCPYLRLHS